MSSRRENRPCEYCGKLMISPHHSAKYHKECYYAVEKERQPMYRQRYKQHRIEYVMNRKKQKNKISIEDCINMAEKLEISYGEYMIKYYPYVE